MLFSSQEASFSGDPNACKKSRTSRACDLCRKKKVKCDGSKPSCSNCSTLGYKCTYLDKPKKRGPQTSQPKALEARLKHLEKLLTTLVDHGGSVPSQIASELHSINQKESNSDGAESPQQDEPEETSEEDEEPVEEERSTVHSGEILPQDISYRYAGSSSGMYLLNGEGKNHSIHDITKFLPEVYDDVPNLPDTFPPPELSEKLLNNYFRRFHPYLPVFHTDGFMKKYREGTVPPILLNAVYGLACIHSGDYNLFPSIEACSKYARMFFLRAKSYLDLEYDSSSIPVIQTLFLMTFSPVSGWLFLGMAIRMAQDLGLHRNIESQNMDIAEKEDRKLLWWCCVTMDRFYSSVLGKPMSITESDFDTKLPMEIASPKCEYSLPSPVVSLRYFTHLIRLTSIINRIMKEVYGVDTAASNPTGKILKTLNQELRDWELSLPAEFKYDFSRPIANNVHTILLTYFCQYGYMLLNRPFIMKASKHKKSTVIDPALQVCSRAASIMTFVSFHTPNGYKLHGVIFKVSFTFAACMIHLISTLSNNPEIAQTGRVNLSFNLRLLQEYREVSSGFDRCFKFMSEIIQKRNFHKVDELPAEPILPPPVMFPPDLTFKTPKRSDSAALLIIPECPFDSPVLKSSASHSPANPITNSVAHSVSPLRQLPNGIPLTSPNTNLNQINITDPIFQYNPSSTTQVPSNLFTSESYQNSLNYINPQGDFNSITDNQVPMSSQAMSESYQQQDLTPVTFIGNPQFYSNHQMDINMQEWNNYIDQFSNFTSPSM